MSYVIEMVNTVFSAVEDFSTTTLQSLPITIKEFWEETMTPTSVHLRQEMW
jgi:hypothetical protein